MPVVGFLAPGRPAEWASLIAAFRQGLMESGLREGQNVHVEYRWAEDQYDRLPALAADLARRQVMVIMAPSTPAALAAKGATTTIPVVFSASIDPVEYGLVASFSRPGGNVTGVSFLASQLAAKQLEAIHLLLPHASLIGLLVNPDNPSAEGDIRRVQDAARELNQTIIVLNARAERDLDGAFAAFIQQGVKALLIPGDAFYWTRRDKIVALAARYGLPTTYFDRVFVEAGGLMSYGTDLDVLRIAGSYVGSILKGEKPENLPVQQSTKVELVINMKTARALDLTIPNTLLGRADQVIE